jgi:hypothetical protein
MKKLYTTILVIAAFQMHLGAQSNVGINTSSPNDAAALDIRSATGVNQGVLFPSVTLASVSDGTTIPSPPTGLIVWNSGSGGLSPAGFYYNSGTSGSPSWTKVANGSVMTTSLTNGNIWIGDGSNLAIERVMSGDATISNTGVLDLSDNAVETSEIQDAAVTTDKIADNSVTGTKIDISGNTNGSLMYYDGTDWVNLSPGTSGQILRTNGAAAPNWSSPTDLLVFENGLTETSPNIVRLGGDLTQNTTITQDNAETLSFVNAGSGNLTINLTGTGDFDVQDNGVSALFVQDNGNVGVGTNAPNGTAKLDISSTTKGVSIPNVALTATNSPSPITKGDNTAASAGEIKVGLMVYNTATTGTVPNNVTPGYYYWDGAKWARFTESNYNGFDLGYVLGWSSNVAPPDFLLPLNGGTFNWVDYPDFQSFNTSYPSQFIASSTGTTFTLVNINTAGRFLRGSTSAGVNENGSTALPTTSFTTNTTGAHVHSVDPPATNTNSAGAHNHGRGGTGAVATGDYGLIMRSSGGNNTTNSVDQTVGEPNIITAPRELGLANDGDHTHTLDIAAFNSASAGDHSHTITGGGDAETRPINTSVVWCLKVKPTSTTGDITIVNTASTAINGLSVYGSAIGLGGSLNQNTNINQGSNSFTITNNGTSNTVINLTSSGDFDIQDNGTSAFFVRDDGRVGIGTTSPARALEVNNALKISNPAADQNDGVIGSGTFGTGLNIVGINSDNTNRKIRMWGGITQQENAGGNTFAGTTTFTGDVTVNPLAGTGNRIVEANSSGTLVIANPSMVYLEQRAEQTFDASNLGFRNASNLTPNLAVQVGKVVVINYTAKFAFTGGSGNDDVRFRIQVTGSCGTVNLEDTYEYEDYDNGRNEYLPVGGNFIYSSTCNGNIQFRLQMDSNSDADDNSKLGDVVIVASRY